MKKILIITGELSGEIHAANLIKEIKKVKKNVEFYGIGSSLLKKEGVTIIEDYRNISIIGFIEIFSKYFYIKKVLKKVYNFIKENIPDIIITVDFPGFNFRVAKYAKKFNIKLVYYIPPQIWAWHYSRIKFIKKYYDLVIPILPFEEKIYKKEKINVKYFGHPIIDNIKITERKSDVKKKYKIPSNKKIIIIMPGSRKQEIISHLSVINEVVKYFNKKDKSLYFIILGIDKIKMEKLENLRVIYKNNYNIMNIADAGIIKSGTSTLESAYFSFPFLVFYKLSYISYLIIKYFIIKVKFVSLVNLIAGKQVVKEFLQKEFNKNNIIKEIENILYNKKYQIKIRKDLKRIKMKLGKKGVSKRIAKEIVLLFNK